MNEAKPIPELLGFLARPEDRKAHNDRRRAYSKDSYRAMYILYEKEVDKLYDEFCPDEESKKNAHGYIDKALHKRMADDAEYRERVLGGYPQLERKMRAEGIVSQEEQELVDSLNRQAKSTSQSSSSSFAELELELGEPYIGKVGDFETAGSVMANLGYLDVPDPKPHPKHRQRSTQEAFIELAESLMYADELQEWLDAQIARGDHDLGEEEFRWDDIPDQTQAGLRKMLAMRYIEWKLEQGDSLIIKHLESQ